LSDKSTSCKVKNQNVSGDLIYEKPAKTLTGVMNLGKFQQIFNSNKFTQETLLKMHIRGENSCLIIF